MPIDWKRWRQLFWKLYFYLLLFALPFFYAGLWVKINARPGYHYVLAFDMICSVVALLGIYAYAHHKALGRQWCWQISPFALAAWRVIYEHTPYSPVQDPAATATNGPAEVVTAQMLMLGFLGFAVAVLQYLALYLYGFHSKHIWQVQNKL